MPAERYYLPSHFQDHAQLELEGQEHHHLVHVMRARAGEEIELINGQGQLATATIESIAKKHAAVLIKTVVDAPPPTERIILAQGQPRLNRLEFILEKGTELGMTEIWLFPAARSEKKAFSDNQSERQNTLLIASMKQCGRLYIPKIVHMPPLKQWPKQAVQPCFFGDVRPNAPKLADMLTKETTTRQATFFVGPESGFTPEEIVLLEEQQHAIGVRLHPNILRTDTAAIAGLTLLSHFMLS